jgi:aminoglycoside phosphotransferase
MLLYEHRMIRQEPDLHAPLREGTDVPVPAILAHDLGRTEIDRDYLLMERLPGAPIAHLEGLTQDALHDILATGRSVPPAGPRDHGRPPRPCR